MSGANGSRYDTICVSKTWLSDTFLDQTVLESHPYKVFRCDRVNRSGGGGCAVFVSQDINSRLVRLNVNVPNTHQQFVYVELSVENFKFVVCCVYNSFGYITHCMDTLQDICVSLCDKYLSVLFLGDFNISNYGTNQNNHHCEKFTDAIVLSGMKQLVSKPTTQQNILDLIFYTETLLCSAVDYLPPLCDSDHCSLAINTFVARNTKKKQMIIQNC